MHTLPHHVEYLSDDWLDEGRRFLEEALSASRKKPSGLSISARLTDAPPHLEFPDDVATFAVNVGDDGVTTSREFTPGAQRVIEGDYQAALQMAQTVGAQAPGFLEAAWRETSQWFGDDCLRYTDRTEGTATHFAQLLHDHLARRTVENPDIAHRAERQGLTRHLIEMETQGYTVIERAISPGFADEVRAATLRALLPHQSYSLQWMLYHGIEFERIVPNPQLMTLVDASLGRGAVVGSISSIKRGPGPGGIPLHTDYSQVPEPYPEFAMTGVGVWALEDWTIASGPTYLVPGSHKMRREPHKDEIEEAKDRGIAIEMPKGSVVYFTHGVWHWQGDRTEPGDRVTLHSHFNRGILRSLEPKKVDVQMLHRNPPRLGEILGEDDWFDKMTAAGRDHLRAGYMTELQKFTDRQLSTVLESARA
jgi:hypothetical protein